MTESSRKGKKISRKACDLCRDRRVQCTFAEDDQTSCRRCREANVPCLFLTDRRRRGPPSRRIVEDRKRAALAASQTPPSVPSDLLTLDVTVDHFVSEEVLNVILHDFLIYIYPLQPLIHVPTFNAQRLRREYHTNPGFLRLCLAIAAATASNIPRNVGDRYGSGRYLRASEMVERASHLVQLSRLRTDPGWRRTPTVQSMVVDVLLSMALHCTNRPSAGWSFTSDAMMAFRLMQLGNKESYATMSIIDQELAKRIFWMFFIILTHDRTSYQVLHTGLPSDPHHTDWEFLMPAEIDDASLAAPTPGIIKVSGPPVISGFVALIKVFVLFVDAADMVLPGTPLYRVTPCPIASHAFGQPVRIPAHAPPHLTLPQLEYLREMMAGLDHVLSALPQVLRLPRRGGQAAVPGDAPSNLIQFEIMRANVHISAIYFQSVILEACLSKVTQLVDSPDAMRDDNISNQLWQIKESIAHELLGLIECSAPQVIEYNGWSMIKKIREVAATFLEGDDLDQVNTLGTEDMRNRRSNYIKRFVEILATVDYLSEIEALASQMSNHASPAA